MNQRELRELGTELFGFIENGKVTTEGLAQITSSPKWDGANAKAIGVQQWIEIYTLAQILDRQVAGLPKPIPGADPDGFMWLTWRTDEREFALEVRPGLLVRNTYAWTATQMGIPRRHQAAQLRSVVEGIRAVFGSDKEKGGIRAA